MRVAWGALLFAVAWAGLWGEGAAAQLHRLTHPVFSVHAHRSPFPSNLVSALARDREGYVWAGTVAGLARYDGRGWSPVALPIPAHRVWVNNNALGVLDDGTLWVGTRAEGLFLLKDGSWTHLGMGDGLPTNAINALLESRALGPDGQRILYVGTYGSGVVRRVAGRWEVLDQARGLPGNHVFSLAEGPEGALYVATRSGIGVLEGDRFRPFEAQDQLPDKDIRQILWTRSPAGVPELWIGGLLGGPSVWSGGRLVRHMVGSRGVSHILSARTGGVWVSFWGGGLARWDGQGWRNWGKDDGLPSAHLRCLLEVEEDGRSVLWMGSDGRGVFRSAEGGWRQYQPRWEGEVEVRTFSEGPDGAFWMAGRNFGLLRFDGRDWRRWDLPTRPTAGDIRCLAWFQGQLWAGCDLELLKLGPGGLGAALPGTLMDRKIVRALAVSGDRLWVGASIGLLSTDGREVWTHPIPGGGGAQSIRGLAEGPGGLWVGTDAGLFRQQGAGIFAPVEGLPPGESILALLSRGGDVWIGTSGGHLLRWREGQLQPLGEGGAGAVQSLLISRDERTLYAGTSRGVEAWDLQRGLLRRRFTFEDGLPGEECLPGSLREDAEGRVWAGTTNGAGVFDPADFHLSASPKPLRLLGVASASGPRQVGCVLPRGETWLDVEFALLAHHREVDTRYRTQLLPVESVPGEWAEERHRRLQSLPRGSYRLRVWARDYRGVESGPLEVPFQVTGRLWEHPLFLGVGSLALLVAGGLVVRGRMGARARALEEAVTQATAQLLEQKGELEELTRQQQEIMGILAHDIRNPLSGISLVAEVLQDEPDEREWRRGLERIQGAVGGITELLNQFLNLQSMETGKVELQVRPVELDPVVRDVVYGFGSQAERKNQRLVAEEVQGQVLADPRVFQEVLSNLVSNALKYSPGGTTTTLRASEARPGWTRIEVADQGPGLTAGDRARLFQRFAKLTARPTGGELSTGLGLAICKRMVEAMGGGIGADGEPGRGTTFWVELPSA